MYINREDGLIEVTEGMALTVSEQAEYDNQNRARVNVVVRTYKKDHTGIIEIAGKTISIYIESVFIAHVGAFKQCINYLNANGYNIDVNYDNVSLNGTLIN